MDKINIYFASNDLPPKFVLYPENRVITMREGELKQNELAEWESYQFICENNKFIPLHKDHADLEIKDFKYIFVI